MDLYGQDPDSWKFKGWLYNNILYPTTKDFREAYYTPGFDKLPVNIDGRLPFYDTNQKGPILPMDDEAPPMPIGGKTSRFSVDFEGQSYHYTSSAIPNSAHR